MTLLMLRSGDLDRTYGERWVAALGVERAWEAALVSAG